MVFQIDLGPDPALEQAVVLAVEALGDVDLAVAEVVHRRPVLPLARDEADLDPIDEAVAAVALDERLGLVRLVVAEVVPTERVLDRLDPEPDLLLIVRGAVPPEQVLEDVAGHVLAALDLVEEVFPNDPPGEDAR
jgi:hypothetical protein